MLELEQEYIVQETEQINEPPISIIQTSPNTYEFQISEELESLLLDLEETDKNRLLNKEEEFLLFTSLEQTKYTVQFLEQSTNYISDNLIYRIRNNIANKNMGLVHHFVEKYAESQFEYEEMLASGFLILLEEAIDRFDIKENNKFSTYASHWILKAVKKIKYNDSPVFEISDCIRIAISDFNKWLEKNNLEEVESLNGSLVKLFEKYKEETKTSMKLETLLKALNATAVLSIDEEKDFEAKDKPGQVILSDILIEKSISPEQQTIYNELRRALSEILPSREKTIIELRFGLRGDRVLTLQEIGEEMGITRERVRQIEAIALKKLRSHYQVES